MRRLNIGCGSVQPEGWDNADNTDYGQRWWVDILDHPYFTDRTTPDQELDWLARKPEYGFKDEFDYIVANHLLSCFSHHELIGKVFPNLRSMLKKGGVLRVLVPNARKAVDAYLNGDASFFPLGEDLPDPAERFCTFLPWFGESKSIFDEFYLHGIAMKGGFGWNGTEPSAGSAVCRSGESWFLPGSEITALDDRPVQSLIMEFKK